MFWKKLLPKFFQKKNKFKLEPKLSEFPENFNDNLELLTWNITKMKNMACNVVIHVKSSQVGGNHKCKKKD